jgi:MacB-like periplasmic core domain
MLTGIAVNTWMQDVRYAVRLLRKSPLFTATAALSLAIGIGADTTIFSIVNALLVRPLPGIEAPRRLIDLGRTQDSRGFDTVSYPYYQDVRTRTTTLSGVYAYGVEPQPMSLGGAGEAERLYGSLTTANYFTVLGTRPALGRLFQDEDDKPGAAPVAVISYALWQRKFGGDPSAVGRTLIINGYPFALIGVAPRGFQGTTMLRGDVWTPMSTLEQAIPRMNASILKQRRSVWLMMGARLRDGVSIGQARAELQTIGAALERE